MQVEGSRLTWGELLLYLEVREAQRLSDSSPGRLGFLFAVLPRRSDIQSNNVTHELNAKFVLREDGSIVLMLHVASDDERKKLAALDGLRVTMKSAEHYGDEIWLTFAKAE